MQRDAHQAEGGFHSTCVQENVLLDGKIPQRLTAVVNLVDLAGSERAKRAGTLHNSTHVCTGDQPIRSDSTRVRLSRQLAHYAVPYESSCSSNMER
jgi:hypothetical protein